MLQWECLELINIAPSKIYKCKYTPIHFLLQISSKTYNTHMHIYMHIDMCMHVHVIMQEMWCYKKFVYKVEGCMDMDMHKYMYIWNSTLKFIVIALEQPNTHTNL